MKGRWKGNIEEETGRGHTGVRSSQPLLSFPQICSLYMCLYMYLIRNEY